MPVSFNVQTSMVHPSVVQLCICLLLLTTMLQLLCQLCTKAFWRLQSVLLGAIILLDSNNAMSLAQLDAVRERCVVGLTACPPVCSGRTADTACLKSVICIMLEKVAHWYVPHVCSLHPSAKLLASLDLGDSTQLCASVVP